MAQIERIDNRVQIAAIADDTRMTILRMLMAEPATLTQIATVLDSYPAKVRHHVKRLERAGLIQLVRSVVTGGYTEKFYGATAGAYSIHMMVLPERGGENPVVILHCDAALEALAGLAGGGQAPGSYSPVSIGSLDGLLALKQGLADVAGCHLLDADSQEYNVPFVKHLFPGRAMSVVTMAHREQGLLVPLGNPKGISTIEDFMRPDVRIVNREHDSGTRVWFDGKLAELGIPHGSIIGYDTEVFTHAAVAAAVAAGTADVGIATQATALTAELEFVPLFLERYDLVMDESRKDDPRVSRLLDTMTSRSFESSARQLGGYDVSHTGDIVKLG